MTSHCSVSVCSGVVWYDGRSTASAIVAYTAPRSAHYSSRALPRSDLTGRDQTGAEEDN